MNALLLSGLMGVVMMFSGLLLKKQAAVRNLAIGGLAVIVLSTIAEMYGNTFWNVNLNGMMEFDRFALLFITIALVSTLLFFLLSARDMEKVGINYAEYFALIFFIICGITLVSSFKSLLILFLGIEIISIPLYILTGSDKRNLKSNEASLKYFLLGAFSTGLMLMGIALVYGATGSFDTASIIVTGKPGLLLIAGMLFLLFSMSFKVSAAPFHFWTPDVYDGAPAVFTSFMATIVKSAAFIGFIRLFDDGFSGLQPQWKLLVAIMIAATLFIGNLTAIFQQSVKRMLAYSSIAQAGFMMLALLAMNTTAKEGILLYASAYSFATIGIFAILIKMSDYTFDGFNGFAKHHPLLAAANTVFLLSLAGIPLTAGFISKFYMLKATIESGQYIWLVITALVMAAISIYYYFRVIQAMYFKDGPAQVINVTPVFKYVLILLAGLIILLGVFPGLLIRFFYF